MEFYCDTKRHLVCIPYSINNLHKMARTLKLYRGWFHNGKFPHYDIPLNRKEEIMSKCIVVSPKDIINIIKGDFIISWEHFNNELQFNKLREECLWQGINITEVLKAIDYSVKTIKEFNELSNTDKNKILKKYRDARKE